jgi:diketogulonate reductase-like aldo/keto reductase
MTVAQKYNKSPGQIMLRWALDREVVVIPKTSRKERVDENANIFDFSLDSDDIERLDGINR